MNWPPTPEQKQNAIKHLKAITDNKHNSLASRIAAQRVLTQLAQHDQPTKPQDPDQC